MADYRVKELDLSMRVEIALELMQPIPERKWGRASEIAQQHGVSRQTIYTMRARAREAVEASLRPSVPGPQAKTQKLEVDAMYIRRAIAILATQKGSVRDIQRSLELLLGETRSTGYISEILEAIGEAAAQYHEGLVFPQAMLGEADEIFQGQRPCLTVVDGRSFLVLHLAPSETRDATAWGLAFLKLKEQGIQFHDLASDGAPGIRAGLREAEVYVPLRPDLFHLFQNASRVGQRLEDRAYDAIAVAEAARRCAQDAQSHTRWRMLSPFAGSLAEDEAKERDAMASCDAWRWLVHETRRALYPFTDGGRIRAAAQARAALETVVELMETFEQHDCLTFAKQLRPLLDDLVAPFEWLEQTLAPWHENLDPDDERLITWAWRHQQALGLQYAGDGFPDDLFPVVQAFWDALDLFHQASSLAESFHSWLRPYLEIHRGMPDWLFPLLMLVWNHHVFPRGKRAGSSPLELAGVEAVPSLSEALDLILAAAFPQPHAVMPLPMPVPLAA